MNLFVISDTHFTHENSIRYCDRPFASVEEMDEAMVARWNAVVRPQDHVYHLGDVAMKQSAVRAVVPRLNGHLRLVRGNHDIFKTKLYLEFFDEIYGIRVLDNLLLTHMPVHVESLGRFRANVHGHVHNKPPVEGWQRHPTNPSKLQLAPTPYVNVSVEVTNYTPVALEDINARLR